MIEFYCTSSALLGLAEYLPLAKENGADHHALILKTLLEVSDYWIKNWMVEHPIYGPYFCKYGITDPRIRDIMVFNTDAQMGLTLRLLARELKNNDQAARYFRLSERLGWQMRLAIFDPITRNGKVDSAAWAYAYIDMAGTPTPQRIEDGNHASYILDFIINLVREKAEWNGKPIFKASDLAVFKTILFDHVMVKDAKGNIIYKFYFDKESTKKSGSRQRELVEVYKTEPAEGLESASGWRRYLGGTDPSLDTGHSIRTSWGWAAAFAGDAEVLTHLFHTYAAAFGFEPGNVVTRQSQKASAGTLLTLTIFWISLPKN